MKNELIKVAPMQKEFITYQQNAFLE